VERLDYLEFIARVTSHIPDKGQVTVRYYGLIFSPPGGEIWVISRALGASEGPADIPYTPKLSLTSF